MVSNALSAGEREPKASIAHVTLLTWPRRQAATRP